jgi:hypothetical protein
MNDWILKHDSPNWLRTIVYLFNAPDNLRDSIQAAEIIDGVGYIKYKNEYYGSYSIYLSDDKSGTKHTNLETPIGYSVICNGDAEFDVIGNIEYLPQSILFYTVPNDIPVNGELSCSIEVATLKPSNFYVFVNKLFDT